MRLLERDSQMAALHEYATDAARGVGRVVLVEGEAGIGKSTLIEKLEESLPTIAGIGAAMPGGLGPGFHFPNDFAPGASFCNDQAKSPGLHF